MKWPERLPVDGFQMELRFGKTDLTTATHKGEFVSENVPEPLMIVRDDMSEEFTASTVYHEFGHAFLYMTDLGQLLGLDYATEEVFCTAFARCVKDLFEHLIENKAYE